MKYLFSVAMLLVIASCYVNKEKQVLTGTVITKPERTMKGFKFLIVTQKQNFTDTVTQYINNRTGQRYEVGKCYQFSY